MIKRIQYMKCETSHKAIKCRKTARRLRHIEKMEENYRNLRKEIEKEQERMDCQKLDEDEFYRRLRLLYDKKFELDIMNYYIIREYAEYLGEDD